MVLFVHSLGHSVPSIDQHLQPITLQKLLDLFVRAMLGFVVKAFLVASARPQQVHHCLAAAHLNRPSHIPHLHQAADRTHSAVDTEEAVLDGCSQWKSVKKGIDVGESTVGIRDGVAQT